MEITAFIPAAGLGTRLSPLTDTKPKALIELNGKSFLELTIEKIRKQGIKRIIINIHHFAEQIEEFVKDEKFSDLEIILSDERKQLLDTGGGLLQAAQFLPENHHLLVYNVDVISDISLDLFIKKHFSSNNLATLAVSQRQTSRVLLFNNTALCGWFNKSTKELKITNKSCDFQEFAFSGIHLISPKLIEKINESGVFSIINVYLRLAADNAIGFYDHSTDFWADLGKISELSAMNERIENEGFFWLK